jgi:hypothetical protein
MTAIPTLNGRQMMKNHFIINMETALEKETKHPPESHCLHKKQNMK